MFKCFDSYCIPWSYVSDGKWVCLSGDDEHNNPVCNNKIVVCLCSYADTLCKHVYILEMYVMVIRTAPLGDDELLCYLKFIQCPLKCNCLLLAYDCSDVLNRSIELEIELEIQES